MDLFHIKPFKPINMSADNGIYIANFSDGSKVIHAQAIDNLYYRWSNLSKEGFNHAEVYRYYKDAVLLSKEKAIKKAFEMEKSILEDDFGLLEYGINNFHFPFSWEELVLNVKVDAENELPSLKLKPDLWKNTIEEYEAILAL